MAQQGAVPRPEFPRPEFVRGEWLNLNGTWEFAFDDDEVGLTEGWHDGRLLPLEITVPFAYQTELSGVNDKSIHEVVWYARDFEVPEVWPGNDVLLHFGAVDYRSSVWVNGYEVGHNQGGHVPFKFDVAPYLHPGTNRLVVRVEDRQDPGQPRGKQSSSGLPRSCDYYCTTGIWQTVWLEPVPSIRIDDIRITPLPEVEAFELRVFLHAPSTGWRIEVEGSEDGHVVARAEQGTASASARLMLRIPGARRWSPEDPHLYDIRVRLYDGSALADQIDTYAGLRDVELRGGRIWLNGEPLYQRLVLDQGYWPDGGLTAPTDEALRADVEWALRFGFNGARKHQKMEDPRWLYWCDRLGLLVWGEMANGRSWSPKAEEWLQAEWIRAIERDRNHPCIIAWVPVNESMGFPELQESHPGQYAFLERMVAITRKLDARRPVIDNDGWEHTDVGDICAIHDYTQTGADLAARYDDASRGGKLPATVWAAEKPLYARGSRYRGQPVMLTEVGGFLLVPEDVPEEDLDRLYTAYGSFRTPRELLDKYTDLMEGIASLAFLSGFCYTQLTDIEQEINGLLTYDRRPKIDPEAVAALHRRLFADAHRRLVDSKAWPSG